MKYQQVSHYAFADITEYLNDNGDILDSNCDVWDVRPAHINTKESRRLNRALGLAGVNKIGNTNQKKKG